LNVCEAQDGKTLDLVFIGTVFSPLEGKILPILTLIRSCGLHLKWGGGDLGWT